MHVAARLAARISSVFSSSRCKRSFIRLKKRFLTQPSPLTNVPPFLGTDGCGSTSCCSHLLGADRTQRCARYARGQLRKGRLRAGGRARHSRQGHLLPFVRRRAIPAHVCAGLRRVVRVRVGVNPKRVVAEIASCACLSAGLFRH